MVRDMKRFREYQKKWEQENRERRREYQKNWEKNPKRKEYIKEWNKNNRDKKRGYDKKYYFKASERMKKYNKTDKGRLNQINKTQNRRTKFKKISTDLSDRPKIYLIKFVDNRDKVCIYCNKEFNKNIKNGDYPTYDHLNAFLPHSEINTVKCCSSCNSSKRDINVLEWLNSKGYKPSLIILELLEKQNLKQFQNPSI